MSLLYNISSRTRNKFDKLELVSNFAIFKESGKNYVLKNIC